MNTLLRYSLIALCVACLSACGVLDSVLPKSVVDFINPKGSKLAWDGFTVLAASDANLNSPVALDIVLVRDDAALALVSAMSASKWFANRNDVRKAMPQGLAIHSVEVAPGQSLRLEGSTFGTFRVVGVMVFADYLTPGDHKARVDQLQGEVVAQLGPRDFGLLAAQSQ